MNTCETCKANKVCDHDKYGFENCGNYISEDVVEVVRCKGCKYWAMRQKGLLDGYIGYCCNNDFPFICENLPCTSEDDYCSYGERRDT